MYQLVEGLDPDRFLALSTQAFREMRASGITTVGEFHYIHHTTGTHDFLYDRLILDAAREAGIRIVLLVAFYRTGGIGKPLNQAQRRCETVAPDVYWDHLDALASHLNPEQTLGTVVHSIRATGLDDLAAVHARSLRRDLPFHIHLEEQRREIEECAAAYGRTPMRVLLDTIETARNVTGVHCTHTTPADRLAFLDAGGRACICPLTEANLGDGLPDLEGVPHGQLCLGTDSNARIDMWEEMRWLEYGQRLRHELRGVLREPGGQVARTALEIATASGAAALGVETGRMAPGAWADFSAVSLEAPALRWAEPEHLLETLMSGADGGAVVSTCVGGLWEKHRLL
jgi:formimidoylglutamate deiminase